MPLPLIQSDCVFPCEVIGGYPPETGGSNAISSPSVSGKSSLTIWSLTEIDIDWPSHSSIPNSSTRNLIDEFGGIVTS